MEKRGESSNQPQKSTTRATTSGIVIREGGAPASNAATGNAAGNPNPPRRVTNQYAPIANVTRIMRRGLAANAKIAEEAKETMQDCVTEFISFITDEANERCQREHRKMITADDLLAAMAALGFDNYVGPLTLFLNKYRAAQEPERGSGSTSQQAPRAADVAPPPPAPPVAAAAEEVVGSDEFVGLTEFLNEYIFGRRDQPGGGEGSSSGV